MNAANFDCQIPNKPHLIRWGFVQNIIPRGGGLVTMTVTNPHHVPPMPVWGVVGHIIIPYSVLPRIFDRIWLQASYAESTSLPHQHPWEISGSMPAFLCLDAAGRLAMACN